MISSLRSAACSLTRTKISSVDSMSRILYPSLTNTRCMHLTSVKLKEIRMVNMKVRVKDTNKLSQLEGESSSIAIDFSGNTMFPDETTPEKEFSGMLYKHLPIINVKATPNNTIMTITDHTGLVLGIHTAGIEGFRNARKGTNIAGQQTANTFGLRIVEKGIKTVRLRIQGIGPGRAAAIKGFELAGVEIVSITDDTRVSWCPPRPRKPRRI
ncbi:mitochondrial ribosomal protein S11 [Lasioglossum baleicum]|uniref:mitochondrial ribosomal protein S11 n=1 Tax=Lasioglossum baleicum TaxID=434251 RepID=UPI003FCC542D